LKPSIKKLTLKRLRKLRAEQNEQVWSDFNELRKEHHLKVTAAKKAYYTEVELVKADFINQAIENAGEPELADQIILDTINYDHLSRKFLSVNGDIHKPIKSFHSTALLRNKDVVQEKFNENTVHMNLKPDLQKELLILAELFSGCTYAEPNKDDLEILEEEFELFENFKRELKGKTLDNFDNEMLNVVHEQYVIDARTNGYKLNRTEPMTREEAEEIMNSMQLYSPNLKSALDKNEMADQINNYSGVDVQYVGHFGGKQ